MGAVGVLASPPPLPYSPPSTNKAAVVYKDPNLNIYSTVCVWWVAETNVSYTLKISTDLINWEIFPHYDGFTTDQVVTNKMWRSEHERYRFFKLETNSIPLK
jgi:hypothetical protein